MEYTSVSRSHLQKAFALAHRLSEHPDTPNVQRAQFRAVAYLIWRAHGEPGGPPPGAGERIAEEFKRAGDPIAEIVGQSDEGEPFVHFVDRLPKTWGGQ